MDTTGELGYDRPLYGGLLSMTDDMLGPSPMHIKYGMCYMYMTDFAYDGTIFLVPLNPSYPSWPVLVTTVPNGCPCFNCEYNARQGNG